MLKTVSKDDRVSSVEDLGPDEESRYWIHLKAGWFSPMDQSHTITARTQREAKEALSLVRVCKCSDCR